MLIKGLSITEKSVLFRAATTDDMFVAGVFVESIIVEKVVFHIGNSLGSQLAKAQSATRVFDEDVIEIYGTVAKVIQVSFFSVLIALDVVQFHFHWKNLQVEKAEFAKSAAVFSVLFAENTKG